VLCDRCGSPIIEGASVVEVTAGELRNRHLSPWDLCPSCADLLDSWLKSGYHANQVAIPAAVPIALVGLDVPTAGSA
jgi:hypothetical protein